jgi:hypothetical protein
LPFYDTINFEVDPSDPIWWSVAFYSREHNNKTFCKKGYAEAGDIDLIFSGQPGVGDEPLLTVLEPAVGQFLQNTDPTGSFVIEGFDPVSEMVQGTADRWYRLIVGVRYSYVAP